MLNFKNICCPAFTISSFLLKSPCRCFCRLAVLRTAESAEVHGAEKQTHFGFETVSESEKESKVYGVFRNVADKYDVMNDTMSLGIHRAWKNYFVTRMNPQKSKRLLDVAGGTGDIALRYLKYIHHKPRLMGSGCGSSSSNRTAQTDTEKKNSPPLVTVCDINREMLSVGRQKGESLGYSSSDIDWVEGNAENLPFEDNSFELYSVAFGIRNMTHIDRVLNEAYRVLRPGGTFMCLEFSLVSNPIFRRIYDEYSFQVIPVMGKIIAGDWHSYQYLVESIRKFPPQDEFSRMIQEAGFENVHYENLCNGIAAIHYGYK